MSDPFRDDREAQLARAEALAVDNEQLKVENAALKEKLAARDVSHASAAPRAPHPDALVRDTGRVEPSTEAIAAMVMGLVFHIRANPARHTQGDRTITLDGQVFKIGRVASAQLRLDDPSVARMHAVIEAPTAAGAFIFDLGSPSGTFVNGQRISRMAIRSGDVIKIGEIEMEITIVEAR